MRLPKLEITKNNPGFTLIELVIVVVIIGIMAGILVSVLDVQEYLGQSRDSRRISDLKKIQTAISNAIIDGDISLVDTTGCIDCDSLAGTTAIDGTGWVRFTNENGQGLSDLLQTLPLDPVNDATYNFAYYSDGTNYEINVLMESDRYSTNALNDGGNSDTLYEIGWDLTLN